MRASVRTRTLLLTRWFSSVLRQLSVVSYSEIMVDFQALNNLKLDFDSLIGAACVNSNSSIVRSLDNLNICDVSPIKVGAILVPLIALCTFKTLLFLKPPQADQIPTLPPPPQLPPPAPTLPPQIPPQQPPTPREPIIRQPSEINI